MEAQPAQSDWAPLSPREAGDEFAGYPGTWAIAGGWAIDLFVGRQTRSHADIDIQLDRAEAGLLHDALPGWLLYAAHGELDLWEPGTPLPSGIDHLWCRRAGRPWAMQLMLGPFTDREWVYRRDQRIRRSRASAILWIDGLPVLAPDIQLLYKAKRPDQPKDEHDFSQALPLLTTGARAWLAAALRTGYGDHPWLERLSPSGS